MSSNPHYSQRRPGPSPTPRKRHLDPDLESNPKRRGTDRDINARFDSMIETMSPQSGSSRYSHRKNRKRTNRTYSHNDNAYMLPTPEHLQNGLSFVKMDAAILPSPVLSDARHSSDKAQVSHTPVSRRRSFSLPEWLATTFMSLSRKHPLRLLLPPDFAQAFSAKPREATQPAETDGLFTFIDPLAPENGPQEEPNDSEFRFITSCRNGARDDSDPDLPDPLPYSTPGPVPRLSGFAVADNPTLSTVSFQTSSSPTLYDIENHLPVHPINCPPSKAVSTFNHWHGPVLAELDPDPDRLPLADNPYLAQIYATPGPTYRTRTDSLGHPLKPGYETRGQLTTDNDHLDFHWRAFDRKRLAAPVLSKAPAFAVDGKRSTMKTYSAIVETDRPTMEDSQTRDAGQLESIFPISPSPFFFSPLDVHDPAVPTPVNSAVYPESHDYPTENKTPPLQMLPSTLVSAIYTPPLSLPPGRTPGSLPLAETGTFSKDNGLPKGEQYATSDDWFMHGLHSEGSPSSLDSVEFWNN